MDVILKLRITNIWSSGLVSAGLGEMRLDGWDKQS